MIKQLKKQITKSKINQTKGICTQITVKKRMNTRRYKKQSNQIIHQSKRSYINENSKSLNNLKYKPKTQIKARIFKKLKLQKSQHLLKY